MSRSSSNPWLCVQPCSWVEIGTDSKTIKDICVGQTLQSCSKSTRTREWTSTWRLSKDDRSHGSKRENRSAHPVSVGDRSWVILPISDHLIFSKFFRMMVARDGVEAPTPAFSVLSYAVF